MTTTTRSSRLRLAARRHITVGALAMITLCAGMTGCSQDGPASPPAEKKSLPGMGSTFIYKVTSQLSTDKPIVSYDTFTVSRTGLTISGKLDVMEISRSQGVYSYYSIDSTGDVRHAWTFESERLNNGDNAFSYIYPVASRTPKTITIGDSVAEPDRIPTMVTCSHVGSERTTIKGNLIESQKVMVRSYSYWDEENQFTDVDHLSWGSSIGFFTRIETEGNGGQRYDLVDYTLK